MVKGLLAHHVYCFAQGIVTNIFVEVVYISLLDIPHHYRQHREKYIFKACKCSGFE
jgi:hypothetical protein